MTKEQTAEAWWIERDGDRQFVCYDTDRGETVVVEVTDANFGGRVDR